MITFVKDYLQVTVADSRAEMGRIAAADAVATMRSMLARKETIGVIFAAAPSQNEFLQALCESDLDFTRIRAYHMDEYIGLPADAPQGFGNFLRQALFEKVPFHSVSYLDGCATDPQAECARYSDLLAKDPPDVVCMGIGENGHIAFNDPAEADFHDPAAVKIVTLDDRCRAQQVHDGCFSTLDAVPRQALTLTIPALIRPRALFCVVPAASKAEAVRNTLEGPVSEVCPASVLRTCPGARLYLDPQSASLLTAQV